ncbi:hypothetical protein LCGC14_2476980 [marine sediment metagenome]|uniref:Uncharacterized protein n=1 Tax=marine sediment metagenome TaxID=412755 RepID=A0A0F9E2I2_9ZZZZ
MPPQTNEQLNQRVEKLEGLLSQLIFSDRYIFHKTIQILDGRKIIVGTSNGLTIATETTQKLGLYNTTPTAQQSHIADPAGQATDLDAEARTAINSILVALETLGITASS